MNIARTYKKLVVWQNAYKLRRLIYEVTKEYDRSEMRRVSQMRDSARSIKQNIQEGYLKTLPSYINYLNIAQGSLLELRGDIEDCFDDGLINKDTFLKLDELAGKTEYLFKRLIQSLLRRRAKLKTLVPPSAPY
jgi:four helix bundle protein